MFAEVTLAFIEERMPHAIARDWFVKHGLRFLRGGGSLEQALGLAGPGVATVRRRLLLIQRDEHLDLAAQAVAIGDAVDLWERCARLAPLLKRFEAGKWSRASVRELQAPPQSWETWEQHALRAFQVGEGVPLTAAGLHKRLNSTPHCSVSGGAARVLARYL